MSSASKYNSQTGANVSDSKVAPCLAKNALTDGASSSGVGAAAPVRRPRSTASRRIGSLPGSSDWASCCSICPRTDA